MAQVVRYSNTPTSSLVGGSASASAPTTEEIQERHMKHIAEISAHLATEPIQSEELTFEQQEWLEFRMARPFPKSYKSHKPYEIPYKRQEDTKT